MKQIMLHKHQTAVHHGFLEDGCAGRKAEFGSRCLVWLCQTRPLCCVDVLNMFLWHAFCDKETPYISKTSSLLPPGALKMQLPASVFTDCATSRPPNNTLFPQAECWPKDISFSTMQYYMPLLLALFDISPTGHLREQCFYAMLSR